MTRSIMMLKVFQHNRKRRPDCGGGDGVAEGIGYNSHPGTAYVYRSTDIPDINIHHLLQRLRSISEPTDEIKEEIHMLEQKRNNFQEFEMAYDLPIKDDA